MRPRMESRRLQLGSNVRKRAPGALTESNRASTNQPIDVECPEPNTFHVKRADGVAERGAFLEKRLAYCTLWLCLDLGHQRLQAILSSLSVIDSGHIV